MNRVPLLQQTRAASGISDPCCLTVLDNGIRIVSHRLRPASSVDITIGVMAGARDEVAGNYPRGTMHCLEHNLAYGSETYPQRVRPLIEGEDGDGEFSLATQLSFTNCHARVPLKRAEFSLNILGAMFSQPKILESDVVRERGPIQAERIRNKLNFTSLENIMACYVAYDGHPLLHPVIGGREGIDAASADVLKAFHAQHIRAGRVVVGVEGDIAHDDAVLMVQNSFSLPAGIRSPDRAPIYIGGDARYNLDLEGTHAVAAFKAPVATDFEQAAAFQVACKLLNATTGPHSIFEALRDQGGAVYSVNVVGRETLDSGLLTVSADLSPDNGRLFLELIHSVLSGLAAKIDEKAFGRIRALEEVKYERIANAKKLGADNLVDDVFMHGLREPPEYYSALRRAVDTEAVRQVAADMLRHPPTFLAAGDCANLPTARDVREIFSGNQTSAQEYFLQPEFETAAL